MSRAKSVVPLNNKRQRPVGDRNVNTGVVAEMDENASFD